MSNYVLLTLTSLKEFEHHAAAFKECELLPHTVKGVFSFSTYKIVTPLNIWGDRRDYLAGRELANIHNLQYSVI